MVIFHKFLACATTWHKHFFTLQKKEITMLEIIITVSLYLGAIALLVKGAISYCNNCQE